MGINVARASQRRSGSCAGAAAVTDLILSGHRPREALGEILRFVRFLADDSSISIEKLMQAFEAAPTGLAKAA